MAVPDFFYSDLSTPMIMNFIDSTLMNWANNVNKNVLSNTAELENKRYYLSAELARVSYCSSALGLLQKDPEDWFGGGISDADKALAEEYDVVRAKAMEAKQAGDKAAMGEAFKKSDAIRDQISAKGLVLETSADGKSSLRKA